ncbi:MAG: lipase maturation factor family protein [Chromatiales bacterium]|nr:lipase maturation factor family protein [Chromatiales bacterium]
MQTQLPDNAGIGEYHLVSDLFVRLLGIFYLIAFVSLAMQIDGLVGPSGILPLGQHLDRLHAAYGANSYWLLPTLFWFDSGSIALTGACWLGAALAVLVAWKRWQLFALIVCYALYLSLYHAGQIFLNFQWDGLLLEAGFLAIFLVALPGRAKGVVIYLFRWLLFRLRFLSGISKLVSLDPAWSGLTALNVYFQVQPLPTPLAWYAHQLPEWLLKTGTGLTLVVEILVPFMMFLPRRWRFAAAWVTIFWQVLILLTSNHNWFNLLTIALCLFLFDDKAVARVLPSRWKIAPQARQATMAHGILAWSLAAVLVPITTLQVVELATGMGQDAWRVPGVAGQVVDESERLGIAHKYHVFPTMKPDRYELEIQGSLDGKEWRNYHYRYKPEALDRMPGLWAPGVVIPHQPRLDWMSWFVTLHPSFVPWFYEFLVGLKESRPAVLALLANNPFPDHPPAYLRVNVYRYRFTTPQERENTGNRWAREALGPFPPLQGLPMPE